MFFVLSRAWQDVTLPLSRRDSTVSEVYYEVHMTKYERKTTLTVVSLWLSGRASVREIPRCEVRFLMGNQTFFFVSRSWQDEKPPSPFLFRSCQKLAISLILFILGIIVFNLTSDCVRKRCQCFLANHSAYLGKVLKTNPMQFRILYNSFCYHFSNGNKEKHFTKESLP